MLIHLRTLTFDGNDERGGGGNNETVKFNRVDLVEGEEFVESGVIMIGGEDLKCDPPSSFGLG